MKPKTKQLLTLMKVLYLTNYKRLLGSSNRFSDVSFSKRSSLHIHSNKQERFLKQNLGKNYIRKQLLDKQKNNAFTSKKANLMEIMKNLFRLGRSRHHMN